MDYSGDRSNASDLGYKKTLQALSCKVCGDSWTRTNDPIDVNDVLSVLVMFAAKTQDLVIADHLFENQTTKYRSSIMVNEY